MRRMSNQTIKTETCILYITNVGGLHCPMQSDATAMNVTTAVTLQSYHEIKCEDALNLTATYILTKRPEELGPDPCL